LKIFTCSLKQRKAESKVEANKENPSSQEQKILEFKDNPKELYLENFSRKNTSFQNS
jgi:hypothetical protein